MEPYSYTLKINLAKIRNTINTTKRWSRIKTIVDRFNNKQIDVFHISNVQIKLAKIDYNTEDKIIFTLLCDLQETKLSNMITLQNELTLVTKSILKNFK